MRPEARNAGRIREGRQASRLVNRLTTLAHDVAVRIVVPLALMLQPPCGGPVLAQPVAPAPEPISPVAATEAANPARVSLGETLFHDRRLSHGDVVACASCHRLDR